jgi:pyridoxamine 5'-phosphate oxidase
VEKISLLESQEDYSSRPRGNQLVAHVSRQSEVISHRAILEKRWMEIEKRYHDREIPKPAGWGGFRIRPTVIEFWQGRTHHLHNRLRYTLQKDTSWKIERLFP